MKRIIAKWESLHTKNHLGDIIATTNVIRITYSINNDYRVDTLITLKDIYDIQEKGITIIIQPSEETRVEGSKDLKIQAYYTTSYIRYGNGAYECNRTNNGMTPHEIVGLLEDNKLDVLDQMHGRIKPDII